jgi:hypothetical protein
MSSKTNKTSVEQQSQHDIVVLPQPKSHLENQEFRRDRKPEVVKFICTNIEKVKFIYKARDNISIK